MANREEGYYWVKCGGLWVIMPYVEQGFVMKNETFADDDYFEEINEARILSPDEDDDPLGIFVLTKGQQPLNLPEDFSGKATQG